MFLKRFLAALSFAGLAFAVANINRTELQEFSSTGRELPLLCAHALCPAASSATARTRVRRICRVCFIINTNG